MEGSSIGVTGDRCRFSARAVIGGGVVELVGFSLLMMLAGGVGLWRPGILNAGALSGASSGLALWAAVSLIMAAFVGGFVAAVASRSTTAEDGLLHGLLSWATACITGAVLGCVWLMAALATGIATLDIVGAMDNRMMLAFFFADTLALAAALAGGTWGARQELHHLRAMPQQPSPGLRPTAKPA